MVQFLEDFWFACFDCLRDDFNGHGGVCLRVLGSPDCAGCTLVDFVLQHVPAEDARFIHKKDYEKRYSPLKN